MSRSTSAINAEAEAKVHSSLKINLEGAAVTGASNGAGRGQSSYVAFKVRFAPLEVAWGTGGHINVDATLRTKCGAPHLMRENRPLRSTWRGLETWQGRDRVTLPNERASQRGTQTST